MTNDQIEAAVMPLRYWLSYSGFGSRGERAKAHLDAFVAELTAPAPDDVPTTSPLSWVRSSTCG